LVLVEATKAKQSVADERGNDEGNLQGRQSVTDEPTCEEGRQRVTDEPTCEEVMTEESRREKDTRDVFRTKVIFV
tara:strand:- start:58 stop:282 length:225 start_codon:yes stop_codon:yes gene_type:complete